MVAGIVTIIAAVVIRAIMAVMITIMQRKCKNGNDTGTCSSNDKS